MYLKIELCAIILHCIYGITSWAVREGGNINHEIADPLMTVMFWLVAILYLASLVTAVFAGKIGSVIACIVFGIIGIEICNAILFFGIAFAVIATLLLAALIIFIQTVPWGWIIFFL